jgi:hypothetical protein
LSQGYQAALNAPNSAADVKKQQDVSIPVVGYMGHTMSKKSQNFYGKNFRDCAIQSKMVQRMCE